MLRKLVAAIARMLASSLGLVYAHEGHTHKVMGTVKAVHADMNHVEITLEDGKVTAFSVTPATRYVQGTKAAKLADLKAGDRVVVEGTMDKDKKMTATKVQIGTAPAAPPSPHQH